MRLPCPERAKLIEYCSYLLQTLPLRRVQSISTPVKVSGSPDEEVEGDDTAILSSGIVRDDLVCTPPKLDVPKIVVTPPPSPETVLLGRKERKMETN